MKSVGTLPTVTSYRPSLKSVGTVGPKGLRLPTVRAAPSTFAQTSYRHFLPSAFRQGIRAENPFERRPQRLASYLGAAYDY